MDEGMTNEQYFTSQRKDLYAMTFIVASSTAEESVKKELIEKIETYFRETSGVEIEK